MTPFLLAAAALVLAALVLLLRPWWPARRRQRRTASAEFLASHKTSLLNARIHRDRLAELERDHANGLLSATDFAGAREELERQLLADTADETGEAAVAAPESGRRARLPILLALLLPLLAVGLYALLGTPGALAPQADRAQSADSEMEALVTQLAQKMEEHPDDPKGWVMLARSYKALGRWDDAERALARIPQVVNQDAGLLADLAEVLAQKAGRFEGRPRELLGQALRLDPEAPQALLLSGVDAFENKRYADAITLWQRLLKHTEPGSENAQMIEAGIARARERLGESGAQKLGAGDTPKPAAPDAQSLAKTAVQGRVELAPALRAKTQPGDTVFVFARAINGPRMPLAVKRVTVAELPLDFTLDDSLAMQPGHGISSTAELRIEARVSRSGQALPSPGDLTGASPVIKPGARGVRVLIDTQTP
ncbi:MAG: c-type cytochrome biogenesis protein CcmI [Betaproteobacteria bacterium HGW-Betaproteobacteria-11]|nr:MAG: c-type cytochrome biogenesis protein CcmI [Betaproteobacteria bacterium HGW-Betaproteobacteria-11]